MISPYKKGGLDSVVLKNFSFGFYIVRFLPKELGEFGIYTNLGTLKSINSIIIKTNKFLRLVRNCEKSYSNFGHTPKLNYLQSCLGMAVFENKKACPLGPG